MSGSVLWEKAPHTEMKHEILRRYLAAWLPILSNWGGRLAVIDGFAGPGEYIGGAPGSPVVILDTIIKHKLKEKFPEIVVIFIEKDHDRADYLQELLLRRYSLKNIGGAVYQPEGSKVKFQVIKGEFAAALNRILDSLQERHAQMAPCFAFVDPFGPSGMPMELIARFMKHPKSEAFINFAFDKVNRFLEVPEYEKVLDELYGCGEWRNFRSKHADVRHKGLLDLYISQLKNEAGIEFVLPFTMRDNKNRELYQLIFGTKNYKGLDQMKQAMWRVDPAGNFQFSDYTYNPTQLSLFTPEPDFKKLAFLIWQKFRSQTVTPDKVEKWVVAETSSYASIHVRRALTLLEENGKLRKYEAIFQPNRGWVKDQSYQRKGAFPAGKIVIEFADA